MAKKKHGNDAAREGCAAQAGPAHSADDFWLTRENSKVEVMMADERGIEVLGVIPRD